MMRYIGSALEPQSWPTLLSSSGKILPEIALAGRSNVGKSSLINLLANQKNLAKISASPGKTRRLQFFSWDEKYVFVDLPGYGYARAPQSEKDEWSAAIDEYLNHRANLQLLLLCLDIRRTPSIDDLALVSWARHHSTALLLVFTKTDMLSSYECKKNQSDAMAILKCSDCLIAPKSHHALWQMLARHL